MIAAYMWYQSKWWRRLLFPFDKKHFVVLAKYMRNKDLYEYQANNRDRIILNTAIDAILQLNMNEVYANTNNN